VVSFNVKFADIIEVSEYIFFFILSSYSETNREIYVKFKSVPAGLKIIPIADLPVNLKFLNIGTHSREILLENVSSEKVQTLVKVSCQ